MATVNGRELRQFLASVPDEMEVYVYDPVTGKTASIIGLGIDSGLQSTHMNIDIDAELRDRR